MSKEVTFKLNFKELVRISQEKTIAAKPCVREHAHCIQETVGVSGVEKGDGVEDGSKKWWWWKEYVGEGPFSPRGPCLALIFRRLNSKENPFPSHKTVS